MRKELIKQVNLYLSGGQDLNKLENWTIKYTKIIIDAQDEIARKILMEIGSGIEELNSAIISEVQLRKTWRRMLNKLSFGA